MIFFGSSGLAVLVGVLVVAAPALLMPLWWLWMWLIDGPHVISTWARTYLDAEERRTRRRLLVGSLVFLLSGPIALAASELTRSPIPFDLFLLTAAIWAYHHTVRQHYGILSIYERLAGSSSLVRRINALFMQIMMWTLFGLFLVVHPMNRATLSLPAELSRAARAGVVAFSAALAIAGVVYAGFLFVRARRGLSIRPGVFALVPVIGMSTFAYFIVGAFEPLLQSPRNPEQNFLAVGLVGGIVHGVQYLGIIFAVNRRRYAPIPMEAPRCAPGAAPNPARSPSPGSGAYHGTDPSMAAALGRAPRLAFVCFAILSLGYLLLNAARGGAPGVALCSESSDAGRLFLGIYWSIFFHHYYLDQKIWRPHRDPALRFELGLDQRALDGDRAERAAA